jgi:hypothetical protein
MPKKIVPDSSGEEVILDNSSSGKKLTQSPIRKNHFFTFFLKDSSEIPNIIEELKRFAYKGKVQTEVSPTTGKQHLQGSIWCKLKHRDTEFKTLKGAHFETLKDVDDVSNYCNKDETHDGIYRVAWGFPEPKYIESIPDEKLYDWELEILTILRNPIDQRKIYWYWSKDGCAGKTTFQKYLESNSIEGHRYMPLEGEKGDMKNGIIEYKLATGLLPTCVLINIPKVSKGGVSYAGIEVIKDMYFFSGKYKGGVINGARPHIFVFANDPPCLSKMTSGRFVVREIEPFESILNINDIG